MYRHRHCDKGAGWVVRDCSTEGVVDSRSDGDRQRGWSKAGGTGCGFDQASGITSPAARAEGPTWNETMNRPPTVELK